MSVEKGAEKLRRFAEECDIGLEEAKTRLDLCEWDERKARETLDRSVLQLMTSAVLEMRDRLNGTGDASTLVTITSAEYRELCGKTALWDEYRADVERWATGGDE